MKNAQNVFIFAGQLGGDPASDWLDLGLYRGRLVDTRRIGMFL